MTELLKGLNTLQKYGRLEQSNMIANCVEKSQWCSNGAPVIVAKGGGVNVFYLKWHSGDAKQMHSTVYSLESAITAWNSFCNECTQITLLSLSYVINFGFHFLEMFWTCKDASMSL